MVMEEEEEGENHGVEEGEAAPAEAAGAKASDAAIGMELIVVLIGGTIGVPGLIALGMVYCFFLRRP